MPTIRAKTLKFIWSGLAEPQECVARSHVAIAEKLNSPFFVSPGRILSALTVVIFGVVLYGLMDRDAPEFGRHPDESAHFITGTLVHDWLKAGFPRPAVDYALHYYARYPKVAFGHWPPVFYTIQGIWYTLFGVSRGSAIALTSTISIVFLVILFQCLRRWVTAPAAFLASMLVSGSFVFQYVNSIFMADMLVAVFSFGAIWCFSIYLDRGGLASVSGFGILSALAILTKQDAIVLAVVPPFSVLVRGRWELLKDWRFYIPAIVVVVLCAPYYWFTLGLTHSAWDGLARKSLSQKGWFLAEGFAIFTLFESHLVG